jgi:hypothetical protein
MFIEDVASLKEFWLDVVALQVGMKNSTTVCFIVSPVAIIEECLLENRFLLL